MNFLRISVAAASLLACLPALHAQVVNECSTPSTEFGASGLPAAIDDTIAVGTALLVEELEVSIALPHTWVGDLEVEIESPAGTNVTLHDGGGGGETGLFLTWSDRGLANAPPYDCSCLMRPSGPGVMADFATELAAGTWTLSIVDVVVDDAGTLDEWCVRAFRRPTEESCGTPALAFGLGTVDSPATVFDINGILGDLQVDDVEVSAEIFHPAIGQLSVTLTSPDRTSITLHDLGGGSGADIRLHWSDLGAENAAPYDCECFLVPSGPGSFADFAGEFSLGSWTLECTDTVAGAGGVFDAWCVRVYRSPETWECSTPALSYDTGPGSATSVSDVVEVAADSTIAGVEVSAHILDSQIGDILCAITSPSGTVVTLHNLDGGLDDDLFVTWSD
ncbi:MAG: proprotein convertase P-domain-containing protein, partial [Planctomycetes bacterium]|nr:proprotein convertase P-domain-containing protein [Planctomycetota bacterium]